QLAGLFLGFVVREETDLDDRARVVRDVTTITSRRKRRDRRRCGQVDHGDRQALLGQPGFRELRDGFRRDLRKRFVELGRRVQLRDRLGFVRPGGEERSRDERRQEEAPCGAPQGRAPWARAWRRRARRMTAISVTAAAKGIAIISRIDQYIPR